MNLLQALLPSTSIMFVSQASIDLGIIASYGIKKRVEAVKNCRNIGKKDMKYNDTMPKMKVDPESYVSILPFSLFSLCSLGGVCFGRIKWLGSQGPILKL